ncbi:MULTISPECIES: HoxN/HupN/NixA family nickel/cobalt transporter [unclassified Streptomyces]|uniref:HoxN/HupN/NixA family nickel/cobalt transporter n=1 Tax=unclassified Streptomyces TaxID=2593676 RepID=UPI002E2BF6EB|nr:hypothetical protein [Streptomyces sp. NBC_00223]
MVNPAVLAGILKVPRTMRAGQFDEQAPQERLDRRGLLNRLLRRRVMRSIDKPWRMCPVGLLLGPGFDTATEVAPMVLAGPGAATPSAPPSGAEGPFRRSRVAGGKRSW